MAINTIPVLDGANDNLHLPLTPIELIRWLEWAGGVLLSMKIPNPAPKLTGSAWPDYASDANMAYGYTGERMKPAIPSSVEIELMDKLLALPSLTDNVNFRRVVNARLLVAPISNRHLYSWSKIAFMLHTTRYITKSWHHRGLLDIASKIEPEKIYAFRVVLSQYAS